MTSTLQELVEALELRFPEVLPKIEEGKQMTEYEFLRLQANREVVDYVLSYLQINSEDIDRDGLLNIS